MYVETINKTFLILQHKKEEGEVEIECRRDKS